MIMASPGARVAQRPGLVSLVDGVGKAETNLLRKSVSVAERDLQATARVGVVPRVTAEEQGERAAACGAAKAGRFITRALSRLPV
jgi:hypothetical protein